MDFDHARSVILDFLKSAERAKNSELIGLIGGNRDLFERVREDLIFNDFATDKDSVGLIYKPGKSAAVGTPPAPQNDVRVFLSYGRRDSAGLVDRLHADLTAAGFSVWRDTQEISAGLGWQEQITDSLRQANVVVAVLSPHSVRTTLTPGSPDNLDSICLAEITFALYVPPPRALVPVMAQTCEPPLSIFHLDYVDMREWSQSEARYGQGLSKLVESIHAATRGEKRYRSWYNSLEPFNFSAFLTERRRDFTGREWLFKRLDAWRLSGSRERALLLTGDPGSGKSALVAELVYRNPDGQVLAYHCCQWDRPDTLRAWRMVRSLAAMVASKLEPYAAAIRTPAVEAALEEASCRADPAAAFEEGFLAPLQGLAPPDGGPRYILIDALDESLEVPPGEPGIVDVLATRLDRLPDWLRLVATTRNDRSVLDRLQGLRADRIDTYAAENAADLAGFVRSRLGSVGVALRLGAQNVPVDAIAARIIQHSAGNFLYAQQTLDGIERNLIDISTLDRLPPGLSGLYQNRLLDQYPDPQSFAQAQAIFEVAIAGQEPLRESLLAAASNIESSTAFQSGLRDLSAYLPPRLAQDGSERYAIFHKSLADWLTDAKRRGSVHVADVRRGHERLAAALWREYEKGVGGMSAYGLAHLPIHLVETEQWDRLAGLLTDIGYMEARNRAGQVYDLAKDYDRGWHALPAGHAMKSTLRLLDEALRRDIQFIHAHREDYPQALFQSLWNYGWWYDGRPAKGVSDRASAQAKESGPGEGGLIGRWFGRREPVVLSDSAGPAVEPGELARRLEHMRLDAVSGADSGLWLRSLSTPADSLGSPQRLVLRGHKAKIIGVWFLPDGRLLSASKDGVVSVWDAVTGMQQMSFVIPPPVEGLESTVIDIDRSPADGRFARATWVKDEIRRQNPDTMVWEVLSIGDPSLAGNWLSITKPDGFLELGMHGGPARVAAIAFGASGPLLSIGHADGTVMAMDAVSGRVLQRFDSTAAPAASTRVVGAAGQDADTGNDPRAGAKRMHHYTQEDLDIIFKTRNWDIGITCAAVSPDGRRVACGTWKKTVQVFDLPSGVETHRLHGHVNRTKALGFSPDAIHLASGSDDYDIRIWDLNQARMVRTLPHLDCVNALAYMADGRRILSGASDMLLRLWDPASGQELRAMSGHSAPVTSVAVSSDGRWALSGSDDRTVRLWDLQSAFPSRRSPGHSALVTAIEFAPDGDWFVSASEDASVRIWDSASGEEIAVLTGHQARVSSVAVSPDGRTIASSSWDKTVRLWDRVTGRVVAVLDTEATNLLAVAFMGAGANTIRVVADARIQFWDAGRSGKLFQVPAYGTRLISNAISPDGALAVVASNEASSVSVWDPAQQKEVTYALRDPTIAGSLLSLWDLRNGAEVKRLRAHTESVDAIAFHPSSRRMATASSDQALLWAIGSSVPSGRLWGVTNTLDRLAYTADGSRIVGGQTKSDSIWVWPGEGGAPLETLAGFGRFDAVVAWEADPNSAQAYVENEGTVVAFGKDSVEKARYPVPLTPLRRHPTRPIWAGATGRHVHLIACEGGPAGEDHR